MVWILTDYHVVYVFIWASGLVAMIPLLLHSLPNTLWQATFFLGPWIIMSQLGRSLEGVLIASHLTLIFTFVLGIWMIIEIFISSGQGIPKMCNSFALLWHNIKQNCLLCLWIYTYIFHFLFFRWARNWWFTYFFALPKDI